VIRVAWEKSHADLSNMAAKGTHWQLRTIGGVKCAIVITNRQYMGYIIMRCLVVANTGLRVRRGATLRPADRRLVQGGREQPPHESPDGGMGQTSSLRHN